MSVNDLSAVLWRERELLELLTFKLEEEQLILAAGRSAGSRTTAARSSRSSTGSAPPASSAAPERRRRRGVGCPLRRSAARRRRRRTVRSVGRDLASHLAAMLELTTRIGSLRDENDRFLRIAASATQETLAGTVTDADTYERHRFVGLEPGRRTPVRREPLTVVSTFGSLQTAYSGLAAARAGLDVTGQNIANAGHDRLHPAAHRPDRGRRPRTDRFVRGTAALAGQGVSVDAIARLASATLDTRVRFSAGAAAYADTRATGLDQLETGLHEPGADGLAAKLDSFWSAAADAATHIDDPGAASALLGAAKTVATALSAGSRSIEAQWSATRTTLGTRSTS